MPYKDSQKQREASLDSYHRRKTTRQPERKKLRGVNRTKRRVAMKALVDSIKEGQSCADCNRVFPSYVLDFDHVRGEKVASVANLVAYDYSEEVILAEIQKCELVCANCHRIRTFTRMGTQEAKEDGLLNR